MTTHPSRSKKPCRPRDHLTVAGKLYPTAWEHIDMFRQGRGHGLPYWPDYVFLPMSAFYAIVSGGGNNRVAPHMIGDVARLAAVGTWRYTQGIYRFDPDLYTEIIATPVEGDLPCDLLRRLPEWCVYIETPGRDWLGEPMYGFFAHIEWDTNTGREELRLLMDGDAALSPLPIHLGPWPLSEAISRAQAEAEMQTIMAGMEVPSLSRAERVAALKPDITACLSLLLYLCSANAEIGTGDKSPANPEPKRTKRGWRLFQAEKPTTWDVGVRLGAALRRARESQPGPGEGTHAGPRPHVRRAHWHTYLVGPGRQERILKWVHPVLVGTGDLAATIRPVNEI